jgi:ribosomal protein S27E
MESQMMNVECPWCAGSATIELADDTEFQCIECAIRVEIAPPAAAEPIARAA